VGLIANKWGSLSADRNYWLGKLNDTSIAFYVDDTQNVTANLKTISAVPQLLHTSSDDVSIPQFIEVRGVNCTH